MIKARRLSGSYSACDALASRSGCPVALHESLDSDSIPTRLHAFAALSVLAVPASPVVAAALGAAHAASGEGAAGACVGVFGVGGVSRGGEEGGPVRLSHVASRSNGHFASASASVLVS